MTDQRDAVLLDPDDPGKIELGETPGMPLWLVAVLAGVMGIAAMLFGVAFYVWLGKNG